MTADATSSGAKPLSDEEAWFEWKHTPRCTGNRWIEKGICLCRENAIPDCPLCEGLTDEAAIRRATAQLDSLRRERDEAHAVEELAQQAVDKWAATVRELEDDALLVGSLIVAVRPILDYLVTGRDEGLVEAAQKARAALAALDAVRRGTD